MRSKVVLTTQRLSALLALLTIGLIANAKTYYVSGAGNDKNNGLTTSTAWKTLVKVNSFKSLVGGDAVLFNRGEVFYGQLVVNNHGSSESPITFGAYGTGADPVISGFVNVNGWTSLGNNIWESTSTISASSPVNMVVINGVNTAMGRYPNTGYITYQSFSGKTSITSSGLSGSPNWTGAEAVIRKQRWIIDRNPVTAQSGGTLTYKSSSSYDGQAGYGFFIQNDARTLDVQNEWYFNPATKKLRIYSAGAPVNVQVTTKDTLVYMKYRGYITFDNLSFQGSNKDAFVILSSNNIIIQNCSIDYSGNDAIWGNQNWGKSSAGFVLQNSTINHTNNNGIFLASEFTGALISHNTFKNTGMLVGMSGSGDAMASAIQTKANSAIIEYNEVDSVGYVGIGFYRNNTIVRNNFVNGFNFVKLDGAGIYTWVGTGNLPFTGQKVLNNIVMNGFGDNSGTTATGNPISHGIYMDDWSANVEIAGNSVANCPHSGIYLHKAHDLNVHNNTSFNNNQYQILMVSSDLGSLIRKDVVKNNIFVSKSASQFVGGFQSVIDDIINFGTIDSNYYARPISDNIVINCAVNDHKVNFSYTLAKWQAYAGFDAHSKKSPKAITNTNDLRFEYNASSASKTIKLDGNYVDVKNVSYNGGITLAPYTSAVLIRSGAATNKAPASNAGRDQTITLPTSAVTLSGSGTDTDGSIVTYSWTKISGPASGTITSAATAGTTVTALVKGIYKFQLAVTDNAGTVDLDTMQVTVNSPVVNHSPVANAGSDQTITATSATLKGSGTDQDGNIASYAWTKISGPASGTITSAATAGTTVTALVKGIYKFQLAVTDNAGTVDLDTVQVTVNSAVVNHSPVANAGGDQTISATSSTLNGSGTDQDGNIASYAWTKISGPAVTIVSPNAAVTALTGLVEGTYQFQLKVTDTKGANATDAISVTVNPVLLPAVNPANTVNGLDYTYYEAASGWSVLPDYSKLTPVKSGTATGFDISQANRSTTFSFNFTGFITVPSDGKYTFYASSDDGSKLYIDNISVVNNDGLHSSTEKSGTIGLKAGKHAITVSYFQQAGNAILAVYYSGPGVTKKAVPASALYRISKGLLPAVNPANTVNGLDYKYYESGAGWTSLPVFSTLTPLKKGTVTNFIISSAGRSTAFSFNFTGFITVPSDGQYAFYTTSDDGSNLLIDNVPVVDNDGLHKATEKSGTIGLKAGKHAISVGFFQQGGTSALSVSYSGAGLAKQAIASSALYRIAPQARSSDLSVAASNETIASPEPGVKVYPNPFSTHIDISITGGAGEYKLALVNEIGKIIWTKSGTKNTGAVVESVNTSALQRGIYFLRLIQNNTTSIITLTK